MSKAAPTNGDLSLAESKLVEPLGLADDLHQFREFAPGEKEFHPDKVPERLQARWSAEISNHLRYSAELVYQLPWEIIAPLLPFSRELADQRARRLFEGHVKDSGYLSTLSVEQWVTRKHRNAKDLYERIARTPDLVLDAHAAKRVEDLGLAADLESFRSHLKEQLAAHGATDPTKIWIERPISGPEFGPEAWSALLSDQRFLDKYYLTERFQALKAKYRKDPEGFRRAVQVRHSMRNLGLDLVLAAAVASLFPDQYLPVEDSYDLDAEKESNGMSRYDEKVEMIFTSPVPHVTIRVGGVVFNYGQGDVQMVSLDQYEESVGYGKHLSDSHTRVEIKMSPEEARALRERLLEDVGKNYPLVFPYNNCVAMTNRAVRDVTGIMVPPVVDRSQVGTIAFYKALKTTGSSRVGKITYAASDGSIAFKRAQGSAANVLDGIYFLRNAKQVLIAYPLVEGAAVAGKLTWEQ